MEPTSNLIRNYDLEKLKEQFGKKGGKMVDIFGGNSVAESLECHEERLQILMLRDQLNHYFSNSNLIRDAFIREKLQKSPLFDLEILLTFNRIKKIMNLSTNETI